MKSLVRREQAVPCLALVVVSCLLLSTGGCGKKGPDADLKLPETPKQAAAQVEEVFSTSEPAVRETAAAASEAVRTGNYEKAVVALQSLKARPSPSLNEGLAVHGYMVTLEAQLINQAAAGDEKAKRAYELLKKMKAK